MFLALMGLIERWWKDKPRADMIRAIVQLRRAMLGCEETYESLMAAKKVGGAAGVEDLSEAWESRVASLARAIGAIESTVQIFAPELSEELARYLNGERAAMDVEGAMKSIAKGLGEEADVSLEATAHELTNPQALAQLDRFIKENFKIDEIHAAETSVWR